MGYKIFIYKKKDVPFVPPETKVITLQESIDGKQSIETDEAVFDDMTTNFKDLEIWDSEKDLTGGPIKIVEKIKTILDKLKTQGYSTRKRTQKDEESITTPNWMFGHTDGHGGLGRGFFNLPRNERVKILMFHLEIMYEILQEFDDTYDVTVN